MAMDLCGLGAVRVPIQFLWLPPTLFSSFTEFSEATVVEHSTYQSFGQSPTFRGKKEKASNHEKITVSLVPLSKILKTCSGATIELSN